MASEESDNFLSQTLAACRTTFMYVAVFSFFSNTLVLAVPLYMLQLFDRVLMSQSGDTLLYLTLLAMLALLTLGLLDIVRSRILAILGHWLDHRLSPEGLKRSIDALLQHQGNPTQTLVDIQTIRAFLSNPLSYTLFDLPWAPIFILIIFLLHPDLGFFTVIGAVILMGLAFINNHVTEQLSKKNWSARQETQAHLQVAFRNAETIQSMGMLDDIIKRWKAKNNISLELSTQASHRTNFIVGISKAVRLALQVGILALGAYLVIDDRLTPGAMITASILLTRAYAPIEQSIAAWKLFTSARSAYYRLNAEFSKAPLRIPSKVLQEVQGNLRVNEMGFTPDHSKKATLKNISLNLDRGEFLLVIGSSAAGKTTLARLLIGIYSPTEGAVSLDGADVYTWERSEFGRYVGYLPQEIELFIGTVQENIARLTEASESDVVSASQMAGAHEFILRLPKGYETTLQDAGRFLSGGQRQQIALARALFKKPRLLILDEPTTYLDQRGQGILFQSIEQLRRLRSTIVVISHHPAFVNYADKILWLEHGEIRAYGPKDEVLKEIEKQKTYREPSHVSL
ncbi:MAG: type I secretion system permease/ATPase [Gammaproteobacteria bacterium]|nr:type I secretion system permease/ATPase [Gammaproteobacteria bacterium]